MAFLLVGLTPVEDVLNSGTLRGHSVDWGTVRAQRASAAECHRRRASSTLVAAVGARSSVTPRPPAPVASFYCPIV